jgi:ankyrin repeat protein
MTEPSAEQRTLFDATNRLWDAITRFDMAAFDAVVAENPTLRHSSDCFFYAIEVGNYEAVEFFLAHGADPNAPDESGRTPLWVASRSGGDWMVRRLVEAGGDPNILPEDVDPEAELRGESPLFYAALHGDEELVAYLWPRTRPEVRAAAREVLSARLRLLDHSGPAEHQDPEPGLA